jgi:ABC-2 type transport system permease protein
MSYFRTVLEISRWEFSRWFKLKSLLITFAVSIVLSLAIAGGQHLLEKNNRSPLQIVILNADILSQLKTDGTRIVIKAPEGKSETELRDAVGRREIDGLLILRSLDSADLIVSKSPRWEGELQQILTSERRRLKLETMEVTADQLADVLAPVQINISYHELSRGPSSTADKITAGLLILTMLIGIFNSLACQMVSITGEKQLRVTEQIISAVTPQQWIDGKILGVSAYAAVGTAVMVLSAFPFIFIMQMTGTGLPIPIDFSNPLNIMFLIIVTLGGFLFWNTFLAAFAATINDPNTSSRTAILFLPLAPLVVGAVIAIKSPDSVLTRVLGLLPITSPAVVPVRIVLTEVPIWEIGLSLVLLLVATWFMRLLAGRIFRIGMLMYGKEPSLKELLRWINEA